MEPEEEVVLGVTQIEYVIDYADIDFGETGIVYYTIFLPSPDAYRAHYKERELPPIEIVTKGNLSEYGTNFNLTIKTFSPSDYPVIKNGSKPTDTSVQYDFQILDLSDMGGYISLRTMKDSSVNAWYADSIRTSNPR